MSRSGLLVGMVLGLVWVLSVGATLWLAARTSPWLPRFDDWPTMVPVLTGNETVTPRWLWQSLNGHRIPLPRLAYGQCPCNHSW